MDFDKLARKAEQIYTERGGAQAAGADAAEVQQILQGEGTLMDKAKRAAKALKEPGAPQDPTSNNAQAGDRRDETP